MVEFMFILRLAAAMGILMALIFILTPVVYSVWFDHFRDQVVGDDWKNLGEIGRASCRERVYAPV